MFETVNKLLEQYIGGQIFFTELDKAVKFNKEILLQLVDAVKEKYLTASQSQVAKSAYQCTTSGLILITLYRAA